MGTFTHFFTEIPAQVWGDLLKQNYIFFLFSLFLNAFSLFFCDNYIPSVRVCGNICHIICIDGIALQQMTHIYLHTTWTHSLSLPALKKKKSLQGKLKEDIWCLVTKLLCQLALCCIFFFSLWSVIRLLLHRTAAELSSWCDTCRDAVHEHKIIAPSPLLSSLLLSCGLFVARIAESQPLWWLSSMWKWRL